MSGNDNPNEKKWAVIDSRGCGWGIYSRADADEWVEWLNARDRGATFFAVRMP